MGNQESEVETEETLRQKYDRIVKSHRFAEVLMKQEISYGEIKCIFQMMYG